MAGRDEDSTLVLPARAWAHAVLGGMASYLDAATIVTASIAFVFYAQAGFAIGPAEMGLLSGILTFGLAFGAVIGGRLGDMFGRRRVLAIDLLVLAVGLACLSFAPDVSWLFAGVVVAGLAMGADLPVSISLVGELGRFGQKGRLVSVTSLLWLAGIGGAIVVANLVGWLGLTPLASARVMFGHVFAVAVVVWALRLRLDESASWLASMEGAGITDGRRPKRPAGRWRELWRYRSALIATGVYYLLWNLQANTGGQFNAYLFTQVAGGDLGVYNTIGLLVLPLGLVSGLIAIRLVDTRWRMPAYLVAGAAGALVLLPPAFWGITVPAMLPALIAPPLLAPFAAENLYRIWTQEVFPTLVRSTAQGITIFFCRFCTGVFALFTPALALASPSGLYWLLFTASVVSFVIGWLWISRLAPSTE